MPELGIFALDLTRKMREKVAPVRRELGGVLVAARHADGPLQEEGFNAGDVIYAINHTSVASIAELRTALKKMKSGDPAAVQIERAGRLRFIALEIP